MQRCPLCGGPIGNAAQLHGVTVGLTKFTAKVPAFSCRRCRSVFMPGHALERVDIEIAGVLAERGPASGLTFRFMRKALGLRASVIASLMDVSAETISRWETSQRPVDVKAWVTLGTIVLERLGRTSSTLDRLTTLKKGLRELPKNVKLDLVGVKANAHTVASGAASHATEVSSRRRPTRGSLPAPHSERRSTRSTRRRSSAAPAAGRIGRRQGGGDST